MGAEATKLGSRDKHPENCSEEYRTSITHCIGSNTCSTMWMILCSLIEALLWPYGPASCLKLGSHKA